MAFGTIDTNDTNGTKLNATYAINATCATCQTTISEMNEHRFVLASNKVPKLNCPYCGAKKHWQRYIDTETGEVLPEQHGRCDNESKCGEWVNPKDTGYAKMIWEQERGSRSEFPNNWKLKRKASKPQPAPEPVYFDFATLKQTLRPERYEWNTFIQNLFNNVLYPFEPDEVRKVIELYRLGTVINGYRAGAITFPFIDIKGNVRAVQVKQFDQANHTTSTDFLHSIIEKEHTRTGKPLPEWLEAYLKQDKRVSCLFGEHLLNKYPHNPIALVEAPKTAVYGTLYFGFPEQPTNLLWLAVYNKSSFKLDKLKVLKGRDVFVFPDLSKGGKTFRGWETAAKDFEDRLPATRFIFSDLLEKLAPQRDKEQGNDLADYLITQDWRLFRKHETLQGEPQPGQQNLTKPDIHEIPKQEPAENLIRVASVESVASKTKIFSRPDPVPGIEVSKPEQVQSENWDHDISELETYFASTGLPAYPLKLDACSTITDCSLFTSSHLQTVKRNNGNRTFLPYLERLQELKRVLTINSD